VLTPIAVTRPATLALIDEVAKSRTVIALAQRDPAVERPGWADLYEVGTLCRLRAILSAGGGERVVLAEGLLRVRLTEKVQDAPVLTARATPIETIELGPAQTSAAVETLRGPAADVVNRRIEVEPGGMVPLPVELLAAGRPSAADLTAALGEVGAWLKAAELEPLVDLAAANLMVPVVARQELLEAAELGARVSLLRAQLEAPPQPRRAAEPGD
jgi:ATP-dependent Lon protease